MIVWLVVVSEERPFTPLKYFRFGCLHGVLVWFWLSPSNEIEYYH